MASRPVFGNFLCILYAFPQKYGSSIVIYSLRTVNPIFSQEARPGVAFPARTLYTQSIAFFALCF
jgi:hypothetical protein